MTNVLNIKKIDEILNPLFGNYPHITYDIVNNSDGEHLRDYMLLMGINDEPMKMVAEFKVENDMVMLDRGDNDAAHVNPGQSDVFLLTHIIISLL